jgi:hypothetical protein
VLLYGLRCLHYKGLLKQNRGYYGKYKTAFLAKNNYNVLFLGSSRMETHYDTRVFDSLTGSNSFNLGMAGATPQVSYAALKAYLINSKAPAYLVYEVDYHFLKYKSTEIKEFNNYFPFLSNRELRLQFNKIDSRINHFYLNPYYSFPFTGLRNMSTSLHGWFNIPNKTDSLYYKGYLKVTLRPALKFVPIKPYYSFFNISDRNYLDSIIQTCKEKKTILTLISSPIFAGGMVDLKNKDEIISQINNIAHINHIKYHDLSSLPFCNRRNLFIDHYHMNYSGAAKYTVYFSSVFNNKMAGNSLK